MLHPLVHMKSASCVKNFLKRAWEINLNQAFFWPPHSWSVTCEYWIVGFINIQKLSDTSFSVGGFPKLSIHLTSSSEETHWWFKCQSTQPCLTQSSRHHWEIWSSCDGCNAQSPLMALEEWKTMCPQACPSSVYLFTHLGCSLKGNYL